MERSRKNLKNSSVIVLALAVLSLFNILFELFFGELGGELKNAAIPDGAPDNILLITQIFIAVLSFLLILPQVYIGIKGLRIAKKPNASRGHIVWGIILIVFTAAGLVSPIVDLVHGSGEAFDNIASLCSIAVDVIILFEFVKYARAVRNGI